MDIPDCYDPVFQAERRASRWDTYIKSLRRCSLCSYPIHPGDVYRECFGGIVCAECFEELSENKSIEEERHY